MQKVFVHSTSDPSYLKLEWVGHLQMKCCSTRNLYITFGSFALELVIDRLVGQRDLSHAVARCAMGMAMRAWCTGDVN